MTATAAKPMVSTYPPGVRSYQFEFQRECDGSQTFKHAVLASSEDEAAASLLRIYLANRFNPRWRWYRLVRVSRWDGTNWKGHAVNGAKVRNVEVQV